MLEQFSETVEKLYAAAANSRPWKHALNAVEQLTKSAGAVVHVARRGSDPALVSLLGSSASEHFPKSDVEQWTRDLAPQCPRLAAAEKWPDAPYVVDGMLLSERDMDLDPVYEWYQEHGVRYFIGSRLFKTNEIEAVWSLQRTRSQGHVQGGEIQLFELLKPHVAGALQLADELGTLRSFERFASAVFEALPQAVYALNGAGKLLFTNCAGETLLKTADGVFCSDGNLQTRMRIDQTRLDHLISKAAQDAVPTSGWARIGRANGSPPYAAFVAPLKSTDEQLMATNAKVLVTVSDISRNPSADSKMLMELFGLTQAEARLACALSGGHSVDSAASLLGVQPATVRSELKSVFRKTSVNRQQDLVRLITSLSLTPRV